MVSTPADPPVPTDAEYPEVAVAASISVSKLVANSAAVSDVDEIVTV
jgi:hypothetical protein